MARLLLAVSGGIAAYKALEVVRLATKAGHAVRVIQTDSSQRFVADNAFAALTGAPVLTDEFERDPARGAFPDQRPPEHEPPSHLELARNADVMLVAPATANTIAKLAHGLADNLLTSAALAADCPLVVAPAMNDRMWRHPATAANVALLRRRGVTIVAPAEGALATKGEWGVGRLAAPPELLAAALAQTGSGDGRDAWRGQNVLVTAGGTREAIDAVRYVGNRSSGRMGFAVAEAAASAGANVTVIAANVTLPRDPAVRYIDVTSAAELHDAALREFRACQLLVMAAAVADFRPTAAVVGKLKKEGRDSLTLELEPTIDVLLALGAIRSDDQVLVGFAAEHGEQALANGRGKLKRKRLDAVVVNDVSQPGIGFESDHNEVTILTRSGTLDVARRSKRELADVILKVAADLRTAPT